MRTLSRIQRHLRAASFAFAMLMLGACVAPAPNGDRQAVAEPSPVATAPAATAAAPVAPAPAASDSATPAQDVKPHRTGGPLPAERVEPKDGKSVEIDFSCKTDADCQIKDVGNCCGYYPSCVNRNSPTDPEGVKAQCAKKGMASVCGFPSISSCSCQQGRCAGNAGAAPSLQ